ncbi:NADH-quinone oxidoreductase subunit C [Paenibacillus humicola]|uniref:NADH-quinone oxidoreductase subunit C n=1 Tax=Paenibacillus humicola TaxID=3110540 RepID=UPI00237C170E|nr:NADH-quinone oxidoreductase subunit C [Paenibacillus humicola]
MSEEKDKELKPDGSRGDEAGDGASSAPEEAAPPAETTAAEPAASGGQASEADSGAPSAADAETPEAPAAAKAAGEGGGAPAGEAPAADPEREAKLKAAAEARAARAAAKAAAAGGEAPAGGGAPAGEAPAADPEREAKLKAAAEARAARAAVKAGAGAAPAEPKPPSPKQPELDEIVRLLRTHVHDGAVEEAVINEMNGDLPTVTVKADYWSEAARLLKTDSSLGFHYLRNVSGVDYESYMEVVYHLVSLETKREAAVKVKTDREEPSVPSATPVWATANWNEREIFDLLGIDFPGHPDLRRIMMPDDWVGHPLRKDYEPLDPEV